MHIPRSRTAHFTGAALALLVLCAAPFAPALGQSRPQAAHVRPQPTVVQGVRLEPDPGAPRVQLVLREGRVAEILPGDAPAPPGHWLVDGKGGLALPAFVDAYSTRGVPPPAPQPDRDQSQDPRSDVLVDMRLALRRGLAPTYRAADHAQLSPEHLDAWRAAGFGYALKAPAGELLSGQGALVALWDGALRDRVLRADAAAQASLSSSGSGYPGTLMGRVAHLRQFVLDAAHYGELERRRAEGLPGPRPPHDPDLAAAAAFSRGEQLVLCAAESAADLRRWLRLREEFGWRTAIVGGREAGKEAARLAASHQTVVLTLQFGDEPKDPRPKGKGSKGKAEGETPKESGAEAGEPTPPGEGAADGGDEGADGAGDGRRAAYREPYEVRLERRLEWERVRDGALDLERAKVPFAFGTAAVDPKELLGAIRGLVERGLAREAALSALTQVPASLYGEPSLGALAPGKAASFALWSADPLAEKDARVTWMFVEGRPWQAPDKPSKSAEKQREEQR